MQHLNWDELRTSELQYSREQSATQRAQHALETMRLGIQIKWDALKRLHPDTNETQLRMLLENWLQREA